MTLHLHSGETHSCHHPKTHDIPLSELSVSPGALHNTNYKKTIRSEMINGQRPKECHYCWAVEDSSSSEVSDRLLKSSTSWSWPYQKEILQNPMKDFLPKYVEVSFSDICNLSCAYCSPHLSTSLRAEVKKWGPYPTEPQFPDLRVFEKKKKEEFLSYPYVEAFWHWAPELFPQLHTLRVTGGEPLLHEDFWKCCNLYLKSDWDFEFGINTNLSVPEDRFKKLTDFLNAVKNQGRLKNIKLFISCDSFGDRGNLLRVGLSFSQLNERIHQLMSQFPELRINLMSTFHIGVLQDYISYLKWVEELRAKHDLLILDISHLEHPQFLSLQVSNQRTHQRVIEIHNYMQNGKFKTIEKVKMDRILQLSQNYSEKNNDELRKQTKIFFEEFEKRHSMNENLYQQIFN